MKNIMYKTRMMCDTLQAKELDVSGAIYKMKNAYS